MLDQVTGTLYSFLTILTFAVLDANVKIVKMSTKPQLLLGKCTAKTLCTFLFTIRRYTKRSTNKYWGNSLQILDSTNSSTFYSVLAQRLLTDT